MTIIGQGSAAPVIATRGTQGSPLRQSLGRAVRRPAFVVSVAWLLIVAVVTIFARELAPYSPYTQNILNVFQMPSGAHLLGTDDVGRDILSRLMFGGGTLLLTSLESVVVAVAIGLPFGLQAGFRQGWFDSVATFGSNVVLAVPGFVVLVALVVISGADMTVVMAVLGVLFSASFYRLVRAVTQATRSLPYVDAAQVAGLGRRQILFRHVLPNVAGPLVVQGFFTYSVAIIISTSLAFLGFGVSPLSPNWGEMVYDASQNLTADPWMMVPVGVVLVFTIMSVNFIGSVIRDGLPQAQRQRLLTLRRVRRSAEATALARLVLPSANGVPALPSRAVEEEIPKPGGDLLLEVEGLTVSFPVAGGSLTPVVDRVAFGVGRGETLALVGESGCGKSMTGLGLLGLVPPPGRLTSGKVLLAGEDLAQLSERQLESVRGSRVAMISQEPMVALDPCFTVGSQLQESLRLCQKLNRKQAAAGARELLRQTGIARPDAVARSYPHQISGGMAQRVSIALALVGKPELLFADEPTTALDVTIQAEILDLLRSLQQELGMTIVLATHDMGVVADVATTVAVMYAGQIVEFGPSEQVLLRPAHPYTQALLAAVPQPGGRGQPLPTVEGTVPLPQNWPVGCRFADRCPFVVDTCVVDTVPLTAVEKERAARCVRAAEFIEDTEGRHGPGRIAGPAQVADGAAAAASQRSTS